MNPLIDVLPPKWRKAAYAAGSVAALLVAAWQASEGDWATFVASLLGSLGFSMASSNTRPDDGDEG